MPRPRSRFTSTSAWALDTRTSARCARAALRSASCRAGMLVSSDSSRSWFARAVAAVRGHDHDELIRLAAFDVLAVRTHRAAERSRLAAQDAHAQRAAVGRLVAAALERALRERAAEALGGLEPMARLRAGRARHDLVEPLGHVGPALARVVAAGERRRRKVGALALRHVPDQREVEHETQRVHVRARVRDLALDHLGRQIRGERRRDPRAG